MLSIRHLIYRFDYEATGTRLFYAFSKFTTNMSLSRKDRPFSEKLLPEDVLSLIRFYKRNLWSFPLNGSLSKNHFPAARINFFWIFFFWGNFHPSHSFTSRTFQNVVLKGHVPCFAWSHNCINLGHWSFLNLNNMGLYMETNPFNSCVVFLFAKTTCIARSLQLVWR